MIFEHNGVGPSIDGSVRVAPNATICGDVTIGPNTSIGFGVVLTAENGSISIGQNCVIMDTAVIRGLKRNPVRIGSSGRAARLPHGLRSRGQRVPGDRRHHL